ncbi:MAG: hypothetical protein ACRDQ7_04185 [Haloechinothrix sp.]
MMPLSAIGALLERIAFEPGFRVRLVLNPDVTLAGYELDDLDHEVLAEHLRVTPQGEHASFPSRSSVLGFLDAFVAEGGL